jgi:hypothetical protein
MEDEPVAVARLALLDDGADEFLNRAAVAATRSPIQKAK